MGDIKVGDKAISFCLPDSHEKTVCLADFSGRWVVLYFYPKDQTPGCTLEAVEFTRQLADFHGLNAEILGVSPDSPKSHCNFIEKQDLELTLLCDTQHDVLQKYGVWKLKMQYGRETHGVERSTFLIDPRGVVASIWRGVKAQGHAETVKTELKKLQAPLK
jgi:thioredoxin-dependent peroxiredoxin